jgi:hypothetical protein
MAMTFPSTELPDLLLHPRPGPGLYILDQKKKGLVPRAMLQDLEAVVTALDDLFC